MVDPSVSDHLRPADADRPAGIYRVVGAHEASVTLLRVGDADGRRVVTGEVVTVPREELGGFEPAPNPRTNRSLRTTGVAGLKAAYWSVRVFLRQVLANPLPSAVAVALVLVGTFGEGVLALPDAALGIAVLLGGLALAYIGSGRL